MVNASTAGPLTILGSSTDAVSEHATVAFAEWLSGIFRHRRVKGGPSSMLDQTDPRRELGNHDPTLAPAAAGEAVWQALEDDRFLILAHPGCRRTTPSGPAARTSGAAAMNTLQRGHEDAGVLR